MDSPKERRAALRRVREQQEAERQARKAAGTEVLPDPLPAEVVEALRKAGRPKL